MHPHAPIIFGPLRLFDKQIETIIKHKSLEIASCSRVRPKTERIWVWKIGWFSVIRTNEA